MTKAIVSICVNPNDWDKARRIFPSQLSGLITDYIHSLINTKDKNITGINMEIEQLKLDQYTKELTKLKAKIDEKTRKIEIFREELAKNKEKKLESEIKRLEKDKNCTNCGVIIEGKPYQMDDEGKKIYCKSCFLSI